MPLDQSAYQTMQIDKRPNGVTVATFNRPEKLNAVNGRMHHELSTISRDFQTDRDSKVLVLTGAGRSFCAGGDFGGGGAGGPAAKKEGEESSGGGGGISLDEARMIVDHILECPKPIVSAVNGYAMGLGATVALLCDVVVAGPSTVFADTHVKLGIGAGDGGQVIWPLLMGVNRAKWYLMTGDRLKGKDAYDMGLVSFLVDDDAEILNKAIACADQLAAGPSLAISASKVPINHFIRFVSNMVLPLSLTMEGANMRTQDAKEAARAFVEKREPKFIGR
ncbi:MAG: enoyl-CoA hydratase-related protein [Acidimicrobiales bacterium]